MEDVAMFQGLHPSLCHCNKFHTASDKAGGGGPGSGPEKVRTSYIGILFALLDVVNQTSVTQPSCEGREDKRDTAVLREGTHL